MIQYYLIHGIDTSRKPFMEDQFRHFGIPAQDVKWILTPNKYDPLPPNICTNTALPRGMVACTYKHYLILKDIVENQYPLAVLMEDNIQFNGDVPSAIQKYLNDMPADWDMVFDSDYCNLHGESVSSVYKKSNEITSQCNGSSKGAHFILFNLRSATRLYESFLPFYHCSDHHYNELARKLNLNVYWAEPPNVHKVRRPSTWADTPIRPTLKFGIKHNG